jgi:site-specific DNA recombinase
MNTKAAVIYCRMSTVEQGESPAQQEAACRVKASALKVEVSEVYIDEAISGSRIDRPAYQQMLQAAKGGQFDTLLLWKQNRLGRDQPEVERAIRQLEHLHIRVVSCNGYDTNGQTEKNRKLLRGITGLVDQVYLDDLGEDTHRGQAAQFNKGYWVGGKVYGYSLQKVTDPNARPDSYGDPIRIGTDLKAHSYEAKVVKEIFHLYADVGLSCDAIAVSLNERGVASPGASWRNRKVRRCDGKWLSSTVACLLANPLYKGEYRWNVSRWVKDPETGVKKRVERPEEEQKKQDKPKWQIIDNELWQRACEKKKQRAKDRGAAISTGIANAKRIGGADSRYWLGSILKCGLCGANYIGDSAHDYICPGHKSGACANDMRVRRDAVNQAVYDVIKEQLLSKESIERARAVLEAEFKRREREADQTLRKAANTQKLRKLEKQIADVRALDLPPTAIEAALTALEAARTEVLDEAAGKVGDKLIAARAMLAKIPAMVADYRKTVEAGLKVLAEPKNVSAAREMVRKLLVDGKIVLTPNEARTAIAGRVLFKSLGDHVLELAGLRRKVGSRPRSGRKPTSQATLVAGAGFEPATFGL